MFSVFEVFILTLLSFTGVANASGEDNLRRKLLDGEWSPCSGVSGTCIDTSRYSCSGGQVLTGRCPGPSQVKCCTAAGGIWTSSCSPGRCKRTATCHTTTSTGLCPGPNSITCCPSTDPAPTPPAPTPPPPKEWLCCTVECSAVSVGPFISFGGCGSTYYDDYGPSKPHDDCYDKALLNGAAIGDCCKWYHGPFCS